MVIRSPSNNQLSLQSRVFYMHTRQSLPGAPCVDEVTVGVGAKGRGSECIAPEKKELERGSWVLKQR
jgi:hypothetical protein